MVMIRAENVSFHVEGRPLVERVSLDFGEGRLTAILGPNGAGKSTLLKLLCGQIKPAEGEVFFDGKPLGRWAPSELARRRAVLPQQTGIPFAFTAQEIVLLGRSPHGDASRCREMALEAMRVTESGHLAERIVGTLSGGELQRVHLARVLVQIGFPRVEANACLMLDEPISNLDPAHQHGTLEIARNLARAGVTVLLVIHDLNLAAQYADDLVLMKGGGVVFNGMPREALSVETIEKVFSVKARIVENPVWPAPAVFVESFRASAFRGEVR